MISGLKTRGSWTRPPGKVKKGVERVIDKAKG
jgi:hypothetical protein